MILWLLRANEGKQPNAVLPDLATTYIITQPAQLSNTVFCVRLCERLRLIVLDYAGYEKYSAIYS